MKILYLSSVCGQNRFDDLVRRHKISVMPQAQKYHHLLLSGLKTMPDIDITVVSSYPVMKGSKLFYAQEHEEEDGIKYIYPGFIHRPIVRHICLIINTFFILLRLADRNSVIVCDVLNGSICLAGRFVKRIKGIKQVGIVTDIPGMTSETRVGMLSRVELIMKNISERIISQQLSSYDGYLLLTEAMNSIVNPKKRPYIVIEGHSDVNMRFRENTLSLKSPQKIMMYAGGVHKEYGIALLVEAFLQLRIEDWCFYIYGSGNYSDELLKISSENSNVFYWGIRPNAEIIDQQLKSRLLVNPRLSNAEYVKYSFPSKILECMSSATPLLTTKLSGMPEEYYPYVYLFEDESLDGFKKSLRYVLSLDTNVLHKKGLKAKRFALDEKNNVQQADKFYLFIKGLVGRN